MKNRATSTMRVMRNLCGLVFVVGAATSAYAQSVKSPLNITPISITTNGLISENFSTLATTGTTNTITLPGWGIEESGGASDGLYAASDGTLVEVNNSFGNTFSYGSTGSTDRALGGRQDNSLKPNWGVLFRNNTGSVITGFNITFNGETWYVGANDTRDPINPPADLSDFDRIDFQYAVIADNSGTVPNPFSDNVFSDFDGLDYVVAASLTSGVKDGNSAAFRQARSGALTATQLGGTGLANGSVLAIQFADRNRTTNVESGLAIDDFTIQATFQPVPAPPAVVSLAIGGLVGLVGTGVGKLRARRRKQIAKKA